MPSEREGTQYVEWRRFEVGDRVRVKLSGECPWHGERAADAHLWEYFEGRSGTVTEVPEHTRTTPANHPDHPYYVQMDWHEQAGGIFAAAELELLERTDAHPDAPHAAAAAEGER